MAGIPSLTIDVVPTNENTMAEAIAQSSRTAFTPSPVNVAASSAAPFTASASATPLSSPPVSPAAAQMGAFVPVSSPTPNSFHGRTTLEATSPDPSAPCARSMSDAFGTLHSYAASGEPTPPGVLNAPSSDASTPDGVGAAPSGADEDPVTFGSQFHPSAPSDGRSAGNFGIHRTFSGGPTSRSIAVQRRPPVRDNDYSYRATMERAERMPDFETLEEFQDCLGGPRSEPLRPHELVSMMDSATGEPHGIRRMQPRPSVQARFYH